MYDHLHPDLLDEELGESKGEPTGSDQLTLWWAAKCVCGETFDWWESRCSTCGRVR